MGAKNIYIAYILWLFFGWLGVHHFYLGRDRHAFVWWCSLGGVFGLGWLREVFRISDYVEEANQSQTYFEYLTAMMNMYQKPPITAARFLGEILIGALFGLTLRCAIPEELIIENKWLELLIVPSATAVGVYTVANIGKEACTYRSCLIGAGVGAIFLLLDSTNFMTVSFICTLYANWRGKSWRRDPPRNKAVCKRIFTLTLCGTLYLSLWGSAFINNTYVTTSDGHRVRARQAIINYFNSPAWQNLKDTMENLKNEWNENGWESAYDEFILSIDPEGELHSFKVLGINSSATEKEINAAYRKLAKEWHPDKFQDEKEREKATAKFMEIKEARETLSSISARRSKRNNKFRKEEL